MIDEIHAMNVALIRDAVLVPSKGLTVLTGETGAGKTALLSACKLLCGERAEASTVREGAAELHVEGRFFFGAEEQIATRRVGADGRSRVSINGSMASVKELQSVVGPLVDLCGQHEHQQLLRSSTHVGLLDAWAGESVSELLEDYRQVFSQCEEAAHKLEQVREASQASSAKLEEARFILQRIDAVGPSEDEYEKMLASLALAEHAEALASASEGAHAALSGEEGAIDALQKAVSLLESLASVDAKLGELALSLREAGYVLEDVSQETRRYRDTIEFDQESLESAQERMSSLQGLLRAYGPRMEDVFAAREAAADFISLVDDSAERERLAHENLAAAEEALARSADRLDDARQAAAPAFTEEVNKQLMRLEMGSASLVCAIKRMERKHWTKTGPSQVEFQFQPAEGMQARPLARIASGGEISRVMLAIKVVLGKADAVETLIFDEVDAGVGGTAALALASVLVDLAASHQVIVVTHLAQIAVAGDAHYQVVKKDLADDGIPETVLVELGDEERVEEIARMLSGEASEASLGHAREMLENAKR